MRREVRTALAKYITRQGAYHLVHHNAIGFFRLQALGALSMTGFDFGARGHANHLLKTPEGKIAPRRRKSKHYFGLSPSTRVSPDAADPDLASLRPQSWLARYRRGTCRPACDRPQQHGDHRAGGRFDDYRGHVAG